MGELVKLSVGGSMMDCYVARPESNALGGVLVCMHGPGVDEFMRDICMRLAAEGYLAIAPNVYHRQETDSSEPWTKLDDSEAISDMQAATEFLVDSTPESLGVVGFCMGGRLAFLELANDDRLRTGVVFHGGNIMVARGSLPSPLDQAGAIGASILGIFGDDDSNPSPSDRKEIEKRLQTHEVIYRFESYKGAGHAFLNFTRPEVYRERQAELAWSLCLSWLKLEMRSSA
jgi:carboxymethylenebutenolidase